MIDFETDKMHGDEYNASVKFCNQGEEIFPCAGCGENIWICKNKDVWVPVSWDTDTSHKCPHPERIPKRKRRGPKQHRKIILKKP